MSPLDLSRESRSPLAGWAKLSIDHARQAATLYLDISRRSLLGAAGAAMLVCACAIAASPVHAQGWSQSWEPQPRPRLKAKPKPPLAEHLAKEPFGQIPKGPVQIVISI